MILYDDKRITKELDKFHMSNIPFRSRRGKILRVKIGYNPNSSSMGSVVFALPTMLLSSAVVFGGVASAIFSAFMGSDDTASDDNVPVSSEEDVEK